MTLAEFRARLLRCGRMMTGSDVRGAHDRARATDLEQPGNRAPPEIGGLWALAILLLPACFIFTGHPILWPQWTRYFFVFGLPYVICIALWVYPGKRAEPE